MKPVRYATVDADEYSALRTERDNAKELYEKCYALLEKANKEVEALTNEKYQLMVERDEARSALVEIRNICIAMMDGWGQTVTVLAGIRDIVTKAIGFGHPGEKPQRPQTFA